ncbi:MAG: hypothetical protein QOI02_1478, partial [Actinomycetota bacterium]|nr:hypothetical protein [Actinomycetota bacterium]
IGGGSASTIFSPTDEAFLNAAAAGIFVAAAAGNAGPGASTLDNAAPWETTVAASTAPSYEATLVLGNGHKYVGASITVDHIVDPDQAPTPDPYLTKHIVLATAAKKSSVSSAKAIDCRKGSLDAHKTAGKIVVCDRDGKVDRVEMSKTVKDAGGAGMVLLNTVKNSLDLDNHSIPTIHIDQPSRAAIRAYAGSAGSTATFVPENLGASTPVPQIAGFSSRGPVTAGGGDTLKPDIAAPGVAILAAVATTLPSGATPLTNNWAFYSGTSMATPHIAGIAALYLGNTPNASPSEIKSAMMTTAIDTVSASNAEVTDPFVQGAGEVIPSSLLNAGLFYLSTVSDWKSYVQGTGDSSFGPGVTAIDPSDLNQASIAIGSLVGHQTITRTVTAQSAGTFTAQISGMSGVDTVVTPSTLNFSAAGEQHSFTVTFTRTTAPVNKYSRGFLTWTFGTTKVRSPIAVKPVPVAAAVHGTGTNGHADVTASLGVKATVPLYVSGLAKKVVAPNPTDPSAGFTGHFATASQTGDPWGAASVAHVDHITTSTSYLRYSAESLSSSPGTDLDLYVFYSANSYNHDSLYDIMYDVFFGGTRYKLISSPNSAASETKSIVKPKAGYYISFVDPYALPVGGVDYNFATYNLRSSTSTGHFTASASSIHSTVAAENTFQVRWGGLAENSSYLGVVQYGTGSSRTIVTVDTADATPVENLSPPTVSGSQVVGSRLTGTAGTWNVASKYLSPLTWEWLRDGTPITGATTSTYTLTPDDFGHQVALRVTAGLGAAAAVVVETTPGAVVKARPAISFRFEDATISHTLPPQLFVSLSSNPSGPDVTLGQIKITYGSKSTTVDYVNSTDPIDLPLLKKGSYSVSVTYLGSDEIATGRSATHTLTVS